MRAMILAAGEGTRLRPLTSEVPKPLVPLFNRPLLFHALHRARDAGVAEAIVNAFHLGHLVVGAVGVGVPGGPRLRISEEDTLLGTGGGLARAGWFFRDEQDFVVLNGDVVCDVDLAAAVAAHRATGAVATLVVVRRPDLPAALHKVAWNEQTGRIVEVDGVPLAGGPGLARGIYTGVLVGSRALLDVLPKDGPACLKEDGFWPLLRAGASLHAHETTAYWSDVGTPARYLDTHLELLARGSAPLPPDYREIDAGVFAHPSARIADDAALTAPVVVGPGTRIDPGAHVGPGVVLGADVYLTADVRISESIVWDGVIVRGESHRQIWWRKGVVDALR